MREQIARANNAIFTTSQNNPECAGMGTTLVVCLFYDNFVTGHIATRASTGCGATRWSR